MVSPGRDVPADDSPESWTLSRLLVTATRLVEHGIAEELRPYGLTHAGFGVLAMVHPGPLSQREIAHRARVEEQTVSRTVERLERLDLVRRSRDPHDRRRVLVEPTAAGRRAFRAATRHDRAEELLAELPDPEGFRAQLATLVRRLGGEDAVPLPDEH
ncbi:MAG: MarR family transcriptional regulator [Candidatus Nanopelagicales bacterium]